MASAKGQYHVGGARPPYGHNTGPTTQVLDSVGDKIGTVLTAPDGSQPITHIDVYVTAIAGTSPTYRVVLEGYNATGGIPDGTDLGGGSPTLVTFQPVSTGLHHLALTNGFTPNAGDHLAAVLEYDSGTIDGSNNATFVRSTTGSNLPSHPYCVSDTSGSWVKVADHNPAIAPVYNDGLIVPNCEIIIATSTGSYNSSSTPDEIGVRWIPNKTGTCIGAWLVGRRNSAAANWDCILYDSASVELVNVSFDGEAVASIGSNRQINVFWEGISVTAGSTYYLVAKPTTTSSILVNEQTFANAAHRASYNGAALMKTEQTDGGGFTETDTEMRSIGPILSDIAAGAGGGLLVHPGTSGGARG